MGFAFRFTPGGGRTDGRMVREHTPWRLNTGVETANRNTVAAPTAPRTDFASALAPRLGGSMLPQMDFRTDATRDASNNAAWQSTMAGVRARKAARESEAATAGLQSAGFVPGMPADFKAPPLAIPSDTAPTPNLANVSDAGAEPPLNTAQRWTRQGQAMANGLKLGGNALTARDVAAGYQTGNPADILKKYGTQGATASVYTPPSGKNPIGSYASLPY